MPELQIRPMTVEDADLIRLQRELMFQNNGIDQATLDAMREPFVAWVKPKLADGSYLGWAGVRDGVVVAGMGIMIVDWPPHPQHPTDDRRAYILNVYVAPEERGKGTAKLLMTLAEDESRKLGIEYAVLHASPMGRPVYDRSGWKATNEMAKSLIGRAGTSADSL